MRRLTKDSVLLHSVELNDVDEDDLKEQQNIMLFYDTVVYETAGGA